MAAGQSNSPTPLGVPACGFCKGSSRKPLYISPLRAQGAGGPQRCFFYCGGVQAGAGSRAPRCGSDFFKFYVFLKEIIGFRAPRGSRGHSRRARWAQICVRWSTWGSKAGPSGARGALRGSPWSPRGHFSGFLRAENRGSESRLRTPLAGVTILVCVLSLPCSPWWPASEHKCVR